MKPYFLAQPDSGAEPWRLYLTVGKKWVLLASGTLAECLERLSQEFEHNGFSGMER